VSQQARPVRVGLDGTPLLGTRSGIGTYVHHLVEGLATAGPEVNLTVTAFTRRGFGALRGAVPPGATVAGASVPARVLRTAWLHGSWPTAESLVGPVDLFHGPNFVVPPTRRAAAVLTVHDLAYLKYADTVASDSLAYRELVPRAIRRGAAVCTVTRAVAEEVVDAYPAVRGRVFVTPLGVDPSWRAAVPASASTPTPHALPERYTVAVGTVEPRKNLRALVSAYRLASRRGTPLPPLVIAGPAGWGDELDLSGLPEGHVIRLGHVPSTTLQSVVAGAQLLLFPSRYEGFGLPPLEALACGVPVLAADLAVTREVLGDQAAFTRTEDPEELLVAIEASLDRPAGTPETRRARAERFSWEACVEATLSMYASVIETRS
jgi:glycosyltransferase involved in cell wall biosynthesis